MCPCVSLLGRVGAGRSGAAAWRVVALLVRAGAYRAAMERPQQIRPSAGADRQIARAGAAAREIEEGVFHDPILERVKRYTGDPPAGTQAGGQALDQLAQSLKLAVHFDPQRLERARGGMDPTRTGRSDGA